MNVARDDGWDYLWKKANTYKPLILVVVKVSYYNTSVTKIFVSGFPGSSEVKASACNAGDPGSIPGSGRSSGEGNGNPLQYCCLGNPMDREAWWLTVHGVAKSQTWLSDFTFTFHSKLNMHQSGPVILQIYGLTQTMEYHTYFPSSHQSSFLNHFSLGPLKDIASQVLRHRTKAHYKHLIHARYFNRHTLSPYQSLIRDGSSAAIHTVHERVE